MKNHIMTHTGMALTCKRQTVLLQSKHFRFSGEKPFACSICGHRFIQAVALRAHMKVHTKSN